MWQSELMCLIRAKLNLKTIANQPAIDLLFTNSDMSCVVLAVFWIYFRCRLRWEIYNANQYSKQEESKASQLTWDSLTDWQLVKKYQSDYLMKWSCHVSNWLMTTYYNSRTATLTDFIMQFFFLKGTPV